VAAAASDDVVTTFLFPDYADKRLPVGEKVTVLVGFQNKGESTFNLTAVGAALHSPFDYNYYIQNFTYREVNSIVGPGEEVTVEYQFTPDKSLEPLEFHLSASLYYNDTTNDKFWRATFINGTIELIEKPSEFTAKTLFTYVLAFAALGLAGYIGLNVSGALNKTTVERGTRGAAPSEKAKAAAASTWEEQEYKPRKKALAFGAKKNKKPSAGGSAKGSSPAAAAE